MENILKNNRNHNQIAANSIGLGTRMVWMLLKKLVERLKLYKVVC
jgi:hypothetical protein